MAYEFKIQRQVEFCDTDMAGIMHFSNFFRFMEVAEHAFYRSLGFGVYPEAIEGQVGWPRVHASCDYKRPLRFEETVEIHLLVREKKSKTITYTFIFRKSEGGKMIEVARGSIIAVAVRIDKATRRMKAVTIPPEIADLIQVAPAGTLPRGQMAMTTDSQNPGLAWLVFALMTVASWGLYRHLSALGTDGDGRLGQWALQGVPLCRAGVFPDVR